MSSEQVQPGLVIAGRYRVEFRLGEGGMGSVFLVRHVHTDEKLALKILHKAVIEDSIAKERFQREARTPARIESDHVVRVTDADVCPELEGAPFLVMEYLRGQDLEQLISGRGPIPPEEVVLYLRQAARALDKAHALGIIHRDLKPENLFLTEREDGTPWIKVLDFGIAKLTRSNDVATKTATGQIFGTPLFMSPEQALAESAKISPQTDVWALGLIAHKLLTGKDIWTADNLTLLVAQIAFKPMPVPSELGFNLGPAYDAWFARCCARDVAQRYPSAGDAVTALAEALEVAEMRTTTTRAPGPRTPAEGLALAQTLQGAPVVASPLKSSAAPLSRTDTGLGQTPSKRRGGAAVIALAIFAAGGGAAWFGLRAGHRPSVDPAAPTDMGIGPVPSAQASAAPAPPPPVTLTAAPPEPSQPATGMGDAGAAGTLPKGTVRPGKGGKGATSASASAGAAPSSAPSSEPSSAPSSTPSSAPSSAPSASSKASPAAPTASGAASAKKATVAPSSTK